MKISKQILLTLVAMPFMAKACDIETARKTGHCFNHPVMIDLAQRIAQVAADLKASKLKNGDYKYKGKTYTPAQLVNEWENLQRIVFEQHPTLPGHKPVPTKQSSSTTGIQNQIRKVQEANIELAKEIGSTYFAHRGGPAEQTPMPGSARWKELNQEEAETQMRYLQNLLQSEKNLNANLQKQLAAAKKYYSAAL